MNKKILEIFKIIATIIILIIGCVFMYWLNHHDMDMCMATYKDYDYCRTFIEEGNSNG